MDNLINSLRDFAIKYRALPCLARTHGQLAVPTTLGKEIAVYLARLLKCRVEIAGHKFEAKLSGAVTGMADTYDAINHELRAFDATLAAKPQIVVANKLDLPHAREALPDFVTAMKARGIAVLELSGATGQGSQALLDACAKVLFAKRPERAIEGLASAESALAAGKVKRAKAKRRTVKKPRAKKAAGARA